MYNEIGPLFFAIEIHCLKREITMKRFKRILPTPKPLAVRLFLLECPLILLFSVIVLISFLAAADCDPTLAALQFADAPATLLASFVLSVVTSLLCDLALRRTDPQ